MSVGDSDVTRRLQNMRLEKEAEMKETLKRQKEDIQFYTQQRNKASAEVENAYAEVLKKRAKKVGPLQLAQAELELAHVKLQLARAELKLALLDGSSVAFLDILKDIAASAKENVATAKEAVDDARSAYSVARNQNTGNSQTSSQPVSTGGNALCNEMRIVIPLKKVDDSWVQFPYTCTHSMDSRLRELTMLDSQALGTFLTGELGLPALPANCLNQNANAVLNGDYDNESAMQNDLVSVFPDGINSSGRGGMVPMTKPQINALPTLIAKPNLSSKHVPLFAEIKLTGIQDLTQQIMERTRMMMDSYAFVRVAVCMGMLKKGTNQDAVAFVSVTMRTLYEECEHTIKGTKFSSYLFRIDHTLIVPLWSALEKVKLSAFLVPEASSIMSCMQVLYGNPWKAVSRVVNDRHSCTIIKTESAGRPPIVLKMLKETNGTGTGKEADVIKALAAATAGEPAGEPKVVDFVVGIYTPKEGCFHDMREEKHEKPQWEVFENQDTSYYFAEEALEDDTRLLPPEHTIIAMHEGSKVESIDENEMYALFTLLNQIHSAGFMHRDLRPANMMRFDSNIRIIDFGHAVKTEDSASFYARLSSTVKKEMGVQFVDDDVQWTPAFDGVELTVSALKLQGWAQYK